MLGDRRHTWALICAGCRSTWITVPFGYDGLCWLWEWVLRSSQLCGVMLNRSLQNLNPNLQATTKVKPQTHSKSSLNPWSLEMIRSRCYIHDLLLLLLLLLFQPGTADSGQLLRAPCPETDSQHLCILMAIFGAGLVVNKYGLTIAVLANLFVQYSSTWCWRARRYYNSSNKKLMRKHKKAMDWTERLNPLFKDTCKILINININNILSICKNYHIL